VQDGLEFQAQRAVAKNELPHGGPVERAVVADNVIAEELSNLSEGRLAGHHDLASDKVGINDDCAVLGEHVRYRRFAAGDTAG
jgi:hypothetical protein